MAARGGRLLREVFLRAKTPSNSQQAKFSFKSASKGKKTAYVLLGTAAVGSIGVVGAALALPVSANELELHPPALPWSHHGFFNSIDMKSVKRGWEVYKQVCAACHSLNYLSYREMVGVFLTEKEAKAEAKEALIWDGPDETGQMFQRPGKIFDRIPAPYKNAEEAAAANNGAVPPDLTYIVKAREQGEDYLFHLLTGYCEAPAGVDVGESHFNPYFLGGIIAMTEPLYTDIIEYSDGTPATKSQLAKDITSFLVWTSDPEFDDRKKAAIKTLGLLTAMLFVSYYAKRHYFTVLKAKKVALKK